MSEKPEALRLADLLNEATTVLDEPFHHEAISENCNKAAAELRRQHAENERLREALEKIATVNAMDYEYVRWARAALRREET